MPRGRSQDRAPFHARPLIWLGLACLSALTVAWTDYETSALLRLTPLYFVPVSIMAWHFGRAGGLSASFACMVASVFANSFENVSSSAALVFNGVSMFVSFTTVGLLIAHLRERVAFERAYARERLEMERQVQQAQRLESLGAMAGGIAHDFNNLLTVVIGHSELALRSVEPSSKVGVSLTHIEEAAVRAAELSREMLAYAGRVPLAFADADVVSIIREVVRAQTAAQPGAQIRVESEHDQLPAQIDHEQFRRMVTDLIKNALESLDKDERLVTVRCGRVDVGRKYIEELGTPEAKLLAEGPYVYIEISDTGCGMDESTIRRAFDPFFSTKSVGRGLGLSAALGNIRAHRGAIKITSHVAHGTQVLCLVPAARPRMAAPALEPTTSTERHRPLILVVDDELAVRSVIASVLDDAGMRVLEASTGEEGVELFTHHADDIALVLLDLTMPVMSGAAALEKLVQIKAQVPVILMSGYDTGQVALDLADRHIAAFLQKPFDGRMLLALVEEHLRKRASKPALLETA